MGALALILLSLLVVAAGRQQDVPAPLARHVPTRGLVRHVAGCEAEFLEFLEREDEAVQQPGAHVGLDPPPLPHRSCGCPSRSGSSRVGRRRAARSATSPMSLASSLSARSRRVRGPAVVEDQGLVEVVRLDVPELLGGELL